MCCLLSMCYEVAFYRRMACGDMSFIVFVGHAVNEIDEIWQIDSIIEGACSGSGTRLVSQNTEECKKIVTLFWYIM